MTGLLRNRKLLAGMVLGLCLTTGAVLWLERTPLLAWYSVRGLARADDAERDGWLTSVTSLDQAAVSELIGRLGEDDLRSCTNVRMAMAQLLQTWGKNDPRAVALTENLGSAFGQFSIAGQQAALQVEAEWLRPRPNEALASPAVLEAAGRLLRVAEHVPGKEGRTAGLELASVLARSRPPTDLLDRCRSVASAGLRDPEPEVRARAVQVAEVPELGLLEQAAALLRDAAPEVRRAAMLAVGPAANVLSAEDLLPWLHDADADVRRLCEVALRSRNISDADLRLGRLITSPDMGDRLQAIEELLADTDREPSEWLRRLSHDPIASVRLAAIRAATLRPRVDLRDRIREMTRSDPSPTVCQLAQYYLDNPERQNTSWLGE